MDQSINTFNLPAPQHNGAMSLEQALAARRSVREFQDGPLSLTELGQLLWAAQGITSEDGKRTAPSAGALYPLDLYVVVGKVEGLTAGIYRYFPASHQLTQAVAGDQRGALSRRALFQAWVAEAPATIVLTANYDRTTAKYGGRGERYVHMEVGHAAQSLLLQAVAMDLGAVPVGAFQDKRVAKLLQLPGEHHPLMLIPVGR